MPTSKKDLKKSYWKLHSSERHGFTEKLFYLATEMRSLYKQIVSRDGKQSIDHPSSICPESHLENLQLLLLLFSSYYWISVTDFKRSSGEFFSDQ
jgi:hypothetical protein